MKSETWRRIDDCLADALELPVEERRSFLRLRLGDDETILAEALRLVEQAEGAEKLFSKGPMAGLSGLAAGSRLGPWELVKPLGTGGMGVVWLARRVDGQATMMAAIKLLPPALSGPLRGDSDLLQRFLMEKQILARLQHPNIARLLDASAGAGESPNFVMEYVEGVPLMEYLGSRNVDRLGLFLKIGGAVEYAHANLIIHRDLKPQNILVETGGEPKLLDFGIGKILNDPAGDASITLRRAFSLDYASPEQIRGGLISTATDVYSLGLILFEMMTGERARRWHDKALGEVLAETERFELPARDGLGADLLAVLRKATALEERQRYRSVSEFVRDVARVRDGMPVEARPAGLLYQFGCFARRNVAAVMGTGIALIVICGLAVWGFISAGQAERARAVAVEKSRQLGVALEAEQAARVVGKKQEALARQLGVIARAGEARAEARVRDLLKVFDSMIVSARWDVAKLPGGTSAGIKILEKAVSQIEVLDPTPAARANFLKLRAEAHNQLADLYGGSNSNVGDAENASKHRQKAVAVWGELHALDRMNVEWERGWMDARFSMMRRPNWPISGNDFGPWKSWTTEYDRLLERAPRDWRIRRSVAAFYFRRATAFSLTSLQRRKDWEKALSLFSDVVTNDAGQPFLLRDVALTHKYLAGFARMEPEQKMKHALEALRLDRQRVKLDESDAGARMDLAFSVGSVADAHKAQLSFALAQPGYLESFLIRKGLALSDPNNAFILRSLLYPIRLHGVMSARLKDWKALGAALKEMEWAAETSRPKAGRLDIATLNYWKGLLALEASDRVGACRHGQEAERLLNLESGEEWIENRAVLQILTRSCETLAR